jgi:hypothetical protein
MSSETGSVRRAAVSGGSPKQHEVSGLLARSGRKGLGEPTVAVSCNGTRQRSDNTSLPHRCLAAPTLPGQAHCLSWLVETPRQSDQFRETSPRYHPAEGFVISDRPDAAILVKLNCWRLSPMSNVASCCSIPRQPTVSAALRKSLAKLSPKRDYATRYASQPRLDGAGGMEQYIAIRVPFAYRARSKTPRGVSAPK